MHGDFIFVVLGLEPLKRIDLILHAFGDPAAHGVRCVIAGSGNAEARCALSHEPGLDGRVTFAGRVSGEQLLATSLAVARCASCRCGRHGFVTVEAFSQGRP